MFLRLDHDCHPLHSGPRGGMVTLTLGTIRGRRGADSAIGATGGVVCAPTAFMLAAKLGLFDMVLSHQTASLPAIPLCLIAGNTACRQISNWPLSQVSNSDTSSLALPAGSYSGAVLPAVSACPKAARCWKATGQPQAVNLNGFPRIGQKLRGTRRHGVQNDKGRLLGEFHQLGRASDRAKIEDSGSARDQHHVGRSRCRHCGRFRVRRGVDHDQLGPAIGRGLQALRQTSVRKRDDNRGLTLSAIAPSGGACLGSRSMIAAGSPAASAAVARCKARVVFPAPPFG